MRAIIATDGSEASQTAAHECTRVLAADASFSILMVIAAREDPEADAGGFEGPVMTEAEAIDTYRESTVAAEGALARAAQAFGATPVRQLVIERSGESIGARICAFAAEDHADVVVVGSHGRRALTDVLLGSVSSYVLHHSPCAVLVIRH